MVNVCLSLGLVTFLLLESEFLLPNRSRKRTLNKPKCLSVVTTTRPYLRTKGKLMTKVERPTSCLRDKIRSTLVTTYQNVVSCVKILPFPFAINLLSVRKTYLTITTSLTFPEEKESVKTSVLEIFRGLP